ncbi:DNA cytosine methyltransferase [Ramlibacter sp. PS3R-8]|uniref:DNA cytosine methyltransferase n=1 Tax=Ramlibacter sp. PS3R-8 TaxID=3133437 RepID=UPI003099DB91
MNDNVIEKLERLRQGHKARVLDLFAGCGGLSLGFHFAGCNISAAVEFDKDAARSHGLNFHGGDAKHSEAIDITVTSPRALATKLKLGPVKKCIDIIVGGPPCQAFARVGRSKLRQVDEHPEAFIHDPRAKLYQEYLHYVDQFEPVAVVMENVPDMLNHGGRNIAEETCEVLAKRGYTCKYTLLNAAFYGVPQMRERMVLIAYRTEAGVAVSFPHPTHWLKLPPGYEGSRAVALKTVRALTSAHSYLEPPVASPDLPPAITAEEAIGDLPGINAQELLAKRQLSRGARRFDIRMPYDLARPASRYAELMKKWVGFEAPAEGLLDHVIRYLPRDYALFARLQPGDQYPEAHARAVKMFEQQLEKLRSTGESIREGTKKYEELRKSIVPPYDPSKFPNKWRKMWRDQPARTLMAHLGKDGYSHIHYDNRQARTISVREAARLQSFPDGFTFCGTMNPAYKQIGNAVPPLLGRAIAENVLQALGVVRKQKGTDPDVTWLKAA